MSRRSDAGDKYAPPVSALPWLGFSSWEVSLAAGLCPSNDKTTAPCKSGCRGVFEFGRELGSLRFFGLRWPAGLRLRFESLTLFLRQLSACDGQTQFRLRWLGDSQGQVLDKSFPYGL